MDKKITIAALDRWLKEEGIESLDIAKYLRLTPSAISRWRERRVIPKKHQRVLSSIVGVERRSLDRYLRPIAKGLFDDC